MLILLLTLRILLGDMARKYIFTYRYVNTEIFEEDFS